MPLRQRLLPTKHTGQVRLMDFKPATTKTNRSRKKQSHWICAEPSLESSTSEKDRSQFWKTQHLFRLAEDWFQCAFSASQSSQSWKRGRQTNTNHSHWPTCPTMYCINVQNRLWYPEQPVHLDTANTISVFLLKFEFNRWFWKTWITPRIYR